MNLSYNASLMDEEGGILKDFFGFWEVFGF